MYIRICMYVHIYCICIITWIRPHSFYLNFFFFRAKKDKNGIKRKLFLSLSNNIHGIQFFKQTDFEYSLFSFYFVMVVGHLQTKHLMLMNIKFDELLIFSFDNAINADYMKICSSRYTVTRALKIMIYTNSKLLHMIDVNDTIIL
jgi:hypothetical protein